jgi:hypothetical protein
MSFDRIMSDGNSTLSCRETIDEMVKLYTDVVTDTMNKRAPKRIIKSKNKRRLKPTRQIASRPGEVGRVCVCYQCIFFVPSQSTVYG